jgi:Spy/CpxP family protein refolding chaperone
MLSKYIIIFIYISDYLSDIIEKYRDDVEAAMDTVHDSREHLAGVMHSEGFNEDNIRQAHQQVAATMEEVIVLKARVFAEIKPLLTPDQIEEIKAHKARRQDRMKHRSGFKGPMMDHWQQQPDD